MTKSVPVSIDAVDYDLTGETTINGSSEPNAKLNVYLNNKLVAKGNANSEGKWRIITGESFSGSQSEIRVDQVDKQNKVLKRAKMNFMSASEPLVLKPQVSVKVVRGNSLWRIARRQYGKGVFYSVIFDANRDQIENPDLIYPGQVFFVPLKDRN
ncbi:MAG: LysM peptidoglycan-binding domain-containing protein [Rhodospirillaceae bacterium]